MHSYSLICTIFPRFIRSRSRKFDELSDSELVKQYLKGEMKAFETLMQRYQVSVYSFILKMVKRPHEAEDLFQDTFFKLLKELPDYDEQGKFKSFLFQIAYTTCLDYLKRIDHKLQDKSIGTMELESDTFFENRELTDVLEQEHAVYQDELKERLQKAIDLLPQNQKEIVVMRYYSDLPFKEIAEIIGCPLNTVLGRMYYALKNLKEIVQE